MIKRLLTKDLRAVAALEFALVAPFLLLLLIGVVELNTLYRTQAKLDMLAVNVAQMVGAESTANTTGVAIIDAQGTSFASMQDICQGAVAGMAPFPASGLVLKIASVTVESNKNGTAKSTVNTTTPSYDMWETDFTVSGNNCTPTTVNGQSGSAGIGVSGAERLATTSPPSTTGTSGTSGLLAYPCDNAIIVQASMPYPGLIGLVLPSRPTLSQNIYTRWIYASPQTELQCSTSDTACYTSYAATQLCNATNTNN
jgi:Flp pilus assembly protein TadG